MSTVCIQDVCALRVVATRAEERGRAAKEGDPGFLLSSVLDRAALSPFIPLAPENCIRGLLVAISLRSGALGTIGKGLKKQLIRHRSF